MAKTNRTEQTNSGFEYEIFDDGATEQVGSLDKAETAAYISDVVLELRNMARRADLKFLVYFLEMAFQEAFTQTSKAAKGNRQ